MGSHLMKADFVPLSLEGRRDRPAVNCDEGRGAARLRSLGSGFSVVDLTGEGDHWYLEPEPVLPGEPPTDSH